MCEQRWEVMYHVCIRITCDVNDLMNKNCGCKEPFLIKTTITKLNSSPNNTI